MKTVILFAFIGIFAALIAAGVFMLRNGSSAKRGPNMARALAVRVGVSIALFAFILFSYWMGWIQPSGLPLNR